MKKLFVSFLNSFFANYAANVDLTCSDNLKLSSTTTCGDTPYSYPVALFLAKPGTTITAVGSIPTPTEVGVAMALSTSAKVVCINPVADGKLTVTPIEIKNYQDLDEKIHETAVIEAVMRYLTDTQIDDLRQLSIHKRFQFWFADARGRFWGAKNGFAVTATWGTLPSKEFGHGTKAQIPIKISWNVDPTVAFATAADPDYLDLDNA